MPRRPGGGGKTPPGSMEDGLRELVRDPGPDIRKLSKAQSGGLRTIMDSIDTPPDWPEDAKAAAVLTVIHELADRLGNHRWRAAAQAAIRIPAPRYDGPMYDSLASRFKALALRDGAPEPEIRTRTEAYRGYWTVAAKHLADALETRIRELNVDPSAWAAVYHADEPAFPQRSLPLSFDRTDVLYRFEGYRGVQSITYRWATAHSPVDHYNAVGWYFNEPDAPVEILPLANCVIDGDLLDRPEGGRQAKLMFNRELAPGDSYFFAYTTLFHSDQPCRPSISYECRGLYLRAFTVRAQFSSMLPKKCWRFNTGPQGDGHDVPETGDSRLLNVASNGYVAYEFATCERGRKYGLRWLW